MKRKPEKLAEKKEAKNPRKKQRSHAPGIRLFDNDCPILTGPQRLPMYNLIRMHSMLRYEQRIGDSAQG